MIYLDNSATTALSPAVKLKMTQAMEEYANPSSLHAAGVAAERLVAEARARILTSMGVRAPKAGQLIFTASGTEADNLAIFGTVYAKHRNSHRGGKIISTDSEHPAVEECLKRLEADGFTVARISTRGGEVDFESFQREMTTDTLLVTVMAVNNETGAAYDLKRLFTYAKAVNPQVVTHTDAVQSYLKMRLTPDAVGADLMTVSAHKVHGPKGVGALYVNPEIHKRRKLIPVLQGGGQENGFRSGTENVIGIAGFGQAAAEGSANLAESISHLTDLREYAQETLGALQGVRLNLPRGKCAPHVLSLTLPAIKSETMLHELSSKDIFVSSGSACSSHSKKTSRALSAFGLDAFDADCTLRVSFSEYNTKEEIDLLAQALSVGISKLVRIRR